MVDKFVPAGEVVDAEFSATPRFIEQDTLKSTKGARREGLKYEAKAQEYLQGIAKRIQKERPLTFMCSPWICYRSSNFAPGVIRYCQPDCLIIEGARAASAFRADDISKVTIVEIKLSHTNQAYKQLCLLYRPVVRMLFPGVEVGLVEVCQWFDPHEPFSVPYYYEDNPFEARVDRLGVHIYNPRKK